MLIALGHCLGQVWVYKIQCTYTRPQVVVPTVSGMSVSV